MRRERSEVARGAGWLDFIDTWLRMIGREFVARTRFDPLHRAATEQQLFDSLPGWLEQLQGSDGVEIDVPFEGEAHSVRLTREQFAAEADALYTELLMRVHRLRTPGHATTIVLGDRAASLPGLAERFAEFNDCSVVRSAPGAAVIAACAFGESEQVEDTVQLRCAVARLDRGACGAPAVADACRLPVPLTSWPRPRTCCIAGRRLRSARSHCASGWRRREDRALRSPWSARRRASRGCTARCCDLSSGAVVVDHSRYGTWLNDERVFGRATLRAGDRLRLGRPGVTLELITSE